MSTFRIIEKYEDCRSLGPIWNSLVERRSEGILDFDVTASFDWCMTLWENFLDKTDQKIAVLENAGEIVGIVPLYLSDTSAHHISCRRIAPITELFSGRCGFLLRNFQYEDLYLIIKFIYDDFVSWDTFQITVVDGSESDVLLREVLRREGYRCERTGEEIIPYIDLRVSWQEIMNTLPTKVRSQLRNRQKRMDALGPWQYQEYKIGAEVEYFLKAMIDVEKASWKEEAGTSLTRNRSQESFFEKLLKVAAANGWFSGHLLTLNNEPIGYTFGLLYKDIFYSCKSSFRNDRRDLSPGGVLRMLMIESLHRRGVNFHDWMGPCQDHKMIWTNKTYTRSTYVLYNRTVRGLAAWVAGKSANYMKSAKQSPKIKTDPGIVRDSRDSVP